MTDHGSPIGQGPDPRGWAVLVAPLACLGFVGLAIAGLFLPFARLTCVNCPLLIEIIPRGLIDSPEGWFLLTLAGVAAAGVVLHLTGLFPSWAAMVSLLCSLTLVALVAQNGVSIGRGDYLPMGPGPGFFVSIVGATGASAAAAGMLLLAAPSWFFTVGAMGNVKAPGA